ncbi:polyamine ABC transporter substrate-binding protein [Falsirhodobacter halotolerans]|uniref:polyamine ABC transporter substrate-binding protein n=1 Tax=Falsirhodobacter halotolerans TaxID=1146892 RepID=UPI001FD37654|nr:polyamine ABC transporter substrate-binding protein [Falsirhodobacter halotolerans]MCJ8141236.1 polyamine ABC transporter substrate-binding protein [Falsirhodobacter halotolerans]
MTYRFLALGAAALALGLGSAQARDLTVVGWGGSGQAAQAEVLFGPFTEAEGLPLQQESWGGGYGILKAKVDTGDINWDVVQVEADELELGCNDGIYEPLDWAAIGTQDQYTDGTASECGSGTLTWAFSLAWDGDKLQGTPTTWADMWDMDTFPGKRGLRKGAKGSLEIALLADGVAPDQVYDVLGTPEGVDRAFAKLDEIKSDIVWWESGAQVLQLLGAGEVAMTSAYDGRLRMAAIQENRNFQLSFDQALYATDSWVILKGTPMKEEAMDLVAFMSQPENLSKMPALLPYGIPNTAAMDMIPPEAAQMLLTAPQNQQSAIPIDTWFWVDNIEALSARFNAWLSQS